MNTQKIALIALALGVAGGFLISFLFWSPGEANGGLRTALLIAGVSGVVLMVGTALVSRKRR